MCMMQGQGAVSGTNILVAEHKQDRGAKLWCADRCVTRDQSGGSALFPMPQLTHGGTVKALVYYRTFLVLFFFHTLFVTFSRPHSFIFFLIQFRPSCFPQSLPQYILTIMRFTALLAVAAAAVGSALAQDSVIMGFNAGATDDTGKAKTQADFEKEFKTAKSLQGAPGNFTTIRLYSNIQAGTTNTPIAAFPAAISTNTKLLLGVWASGTDNIDNELSTLQAAIKQYGSKLTDLVVGISIGSEDLYRVSEPGIRNKSGVGNSAEKIVQFIKDTRSKLAGTALAKIKVTHVDTWTAWVNTSNKAVIDNVDFLAVNAFPFYESERENQISNAGSLLSSALSATEGVAGGKDVWITETGWAYSGPAFGNADATVENAGTYWKEVGCALFGKKNVFWYTLRDANPENKVKFAISDNLDTKPRYDLSCPEKKELPSVKPSGSSSASGPSATGNSTSPNGSAQPSGAARPSGSSPNPSGSPTPSGPTPAETTGNAPGSSVSIVNSMAMALSVIFAFAAFAL
jgi:glucan endo-1,3-beta-D-glucosidase